MCVLSVPHFSTHYNRLKQALSGYRPADKCGCYTARYKRCRLEGLEEAVSGGNCRDKRVIAEEDAGWPGGIGQTA